jgi:uncharacterized protein YndB with AHSA1/START domain
MTTPNNTTNKSQVIAEPGKQQIEITRVFNAPRDLVYKATTDSELITQWWGPSIYTTTIDKLEVKQGGVWRFVQRDADGNEHAFHGVYHLVIPNEQTISTFEYEGIPGHHVVLETTTFEDLGEQTQIRILSVFQSIEDRDGMLQAGMESGMEEGYQRLDELLETMKMA